MIRSVTAWSLKARRAVVAVAVVLLGVGIVQLRHARVDALPEFGPPIVEVDTEALGLSAPEVEQLITVPLEQDLLDGVAWLARIHSVSMPGLSHIEMVFEPGTDLLRARQVVQERISQAAGLPNVSSLPQMIQPESSTSRVMMIGLSSDSVPAIRMSVLARWTIRPRLLGVPGVANVSIWGQRERQLQVQVEPERLRDAGISLHQVIETTGNALWASPLTFLEANTPGTGGFLDTNNQRLGIQHLQPITRAGDLARVPIEDQRGTRLRLGDVARVVEDHQPLIGDAVLTGGPGLLLVIEKFPGANTLEVTRGVEEALEALRPGLSGIRIDPTIYRPATAIEGGRHNVAVALGIAAILMTLALFALGRTWRRTLVVLAGVIASLVAAAGVLQLSDTTIDAIVLAGLVMALVVVIDEAVVDVDRVVQRMRERPDGDGHPSVPAAIGSAALEMRGAMLYALAIIVVSIVPLLVLHGEPGAFFPPMVRSYLIAIAAALVVSLVVTPAISAVVLRAPGEDPPPPTWLQRRYERVLARVVLSARPGYALLAGALALGLLAVPFLRRTALPPFADADVVVHVDAVPGTSLPEMDRIVSRASEELRGIPGVRNVAAHIGRAVSSDQVVDVDAAELWVSVDPSAVGSVVRRVRTVMGGYPGLAARVSTYPTDRIADVLADPSRPLVVRVFGQRAGILNAKAEQIRGLISGVDGVVGARVERRPVEPTIDVRVDLARAQEYGIKPGDVRRAAATIVSGIAVGSLFEQQKVFDVVVWGAPEARDSLTSVRNLLIDTPGGGHVRLGEVADVHVAPAPTAIVHEDISRYVDVTAGVSGRGVGEVIADVERRLEGVRYPLEYHAEVLQDSSGAQAAWRRLVAVAVAAAIGVFLLLQAAFRSWRLAAIAFATAVASLSGGALADLVTGRVVSIGSVAGFFAILAIGARFAIALIRRFQHLESEEALLVGPELVVRGSRERMLPVLTTAVAAIAALLPIAVPAGVAGLEVVRPMAIVIVGGLVLAVPIALVAIPSLCARFGTSPQPDAFETVVEAAPRVVTVPDLEPVGAVSERRGDPDATA